MFNKDGKPLQDLELKDSQPFLKLNEDLINVIQKNLLDIVVYARRTRFEKCTIYDRLAPALEGRQYTLREYDVESDKENDMSLNRCSLKTDHILPEAFKLGAKTPGAENDCTGFRFIMENYATELFNTLPQVFSFLSIF